MALRFIAKELPLHAVKPYNPITRKTKNMKIAVFCSANADIDEKYFKAAEELGRWIGANGHTLVFGGCNLGLMECVAKATREAGGRTIGVVPSIIERGGKASPSMDVCIPCDNLSDRKDLMTAQCDVAVALPGGIGTLDEVFTMAASATIGYHHKPIVLLNAAGFWDCLIALLDDIQQKGMVRGDWRGLIKVASSVDECVSMISE